jgi:hypothetical protein
MPEPVLPDGGAKGDGPRVYANDALDWRGKPVGAPKDCDVAWAVGGREAVVDTGNCDRVEAIVAPVTEEGFAVEDASKGDDKLAKGSRTNAEATPGRAPTATGACAGVLGLVAAVVMDTAPV